MKNEIFCRSHDKCEVLLLSEEQSYNLEISPIKDQGVIDWDINEEVSIHEDNNDPTKSIQDDMTNLR